MDWCVRGAYVSNLNVLKKGFKVVNRTSLVAFYGYNVRIVGDGTLLKIQNMVVDKLRGKPTGHKTAFVIALLRSLKLDPQSILLADKKADSQQVGIRYGSNSNTF